jgi:hypothetical protein
MFFFQTLQELLFHTIPFGQMGEYYEQLKDVNYALFFTPFFLKFFGFFP